MYIYIYIPNIFQVQYKHHLDDIPADPPDLPRSYWRTVPVRMQQDVRAFGAPESYAPDHFFLGHVNHWPCFVFSGLCMRVCNVYIYIYKYIYIYTYVYIICFS